MLADSLFFSKFGVFQRDETKHGAKVNHGLTTVIQVVGTKLDFVAWLLHICQTFHYYNITKR